MSSSVLSRKVFTSAFRPAMLLSSRPISINHLPDEILSHVFKVACEDDELDELSRDCDLKKSRSREGKPLPKPFTRQAMLVCTDWYHTCIARHNAHLWTTWISYDPGASRLEEEFQRFVIGLRRSSGCDIHAIIATETWMLTNTEVGRIRTSFLVHSLALLCKFRTQIVTLSLSGPFRTFEIICTELVRRVKGSPRLRSIKQDFYQPSLPVHVEFACITLSGELYDSEDQADDTS
jgi:hypothetical protein